MNYTIDKARYIKEGDLVEFTPFDDDHFSSRVPKGLYRLGYWDSYYGYRLFNIHDGREIPWCDSTRSNTFFAEVKPEEKGGSKIFEWLAKNWLRLGGVAITLILLFAAFSCSPRLSKDERKNERIEKRAKRKYFKAIKMYPGLVDSTSKTDTQVVVETVTVHTNHYIETKVLDSILSPCDPDTVVRWAIKKQIQGLCTHESLMHGNAIIFRHINGTCVLKAHENDFIHESRINKVHTENTVYMPNEKCERQCEEDKDQLKKDHRYQLLKWCLICVVIGYVLNWVVRVILRSGGLR